METANDTRTASGKRRRVWTRIGIYGGLWLLWTLWLRCCLPETMMGWERHQLFRFSADYLLFFATRPYPLLLYLQAFCTQFYLYPLLGAALISGLLVLGARAWEQLTGRRWPGWAWTAGMLPLIPYFNLLWLLFWLVLLYGARCLSLRRLSAGGRLGLTAGLALAAAALLQENVGFALAFWALTAGIRRRSWREGLYSLAAGLTGAALGLGLTAACGYPLFYRPLLKEWYLLRGSLFSIYAFPANFFEIPPIIRFWAYAGLAGGLLLPLNGLRPPVRTRRRTVWGNVAAALGTALLGLSALYLNLRCQAEDFYTVDRLAGEGRWGEAAETAELAFFQRARPEAAGTGRMHFLRGQRRRARTFGGRLGLPPVPFQDELEENYMADMLKICLLADRQATNRLFAYNGSYYFPQLFPEDILQSPASYLIALYDTDNGLYAEALHLLYDLVTSQRISTAVLKPLLRNSVVVGDYAPCRKFIRFFEQSLFHRDIAHRYAGYVADTAQTARRPEIAAARRKLATHNYTVAAYQPDNNIHFRLQHEADNAAVYEYALALWMVYKNHDRILTELPKIRQYYPTLPTHIQEAVLANFPAERLDEAPADIHPGIKARYMAFLQTYDLYLNGYTSFQKLKKGFEDTYWYHALFNDFRPITDPSTVNGGKI